MQKHRLRRSSIPKQAVFLNAKYNITQYYAHRGRCQYVVQHVGGHFVGSANCVGIYVCCGARLGVPGSVGHGPERDTSSNKKGQHELA